MSAWLAVGRASTIAAVPSRKENSESPFWREALAPYAQPRIGRSVLDLATSVVPYLVLSVTMYLALDISYLLVLAISIPTAGFLLRTNNTLFELRIDPASDFESAFQREVNLARGFFTCVAMRYDAGPFDDLGNETFVAFLRRIPNPDFVISGIRLHF